MRVYMENNVIMIELDGVVHAVSRSQALAISNQIIAAVNEKEDYLSLEKGSRIYYANCDEGVVETGIVYSIHIRDDRVVDSFTVEFPECGDFDEFDGESLGKGFFIDKDRARNALKAL